MDFVTIPNYRLCTRETKDGSTFTYPETINVEHIVSFSETRIDLVNGSYITTSKITTQELAKYLRNKGHNITMIGV